MHETSGVLRPAVEAYLKHEPMTPEHITAIRAYLRQWMTAPWQGDGIPDLRARVDGLTSRDALREWFIDAFFYGIDPL
jgi:hypothetical protein